VRYFVCVNLLLLLLHALVPARVVAAPDTALQAAISAWPSGTRFSSYQAALDFYRQLGDTYRWPPIVVTPSLRLGDRDPVVAEIRRRLLLLGDLPFAAPVQDPDLFDESLESALVHFQRRHGLQPDGVWGRRSRAALEVTPDARYRQLVLNQYRQQQFQAQLEPGGRYVQVNIPAYEMRYYESGVEVLRMRAIVGKLAARTPIVSSRIRSLELNPDWNVPSGIAYRDIVPKLGRSPGYLSQTGLQLVQGYGSSMQVLSSYDLDYSRLYRGPAPQQRFWQAPGPTNPLGLMKFNFPNEHMVYLHGTPNAYLFDQPVRNFSSGCIRIEYPDELARRLFGDAGITPQGTWLFEDVLASGRNQVLMLPKPVSIYTLYWTAWLDGDGELQFRDDIYGHDGRDFAALPPLFSDVR